MRLSEIWAHRGALWRGLAMKRLQVLTWRRWTSLPIYRGVFQRPTRPTAPRPLLSLCGIIYVTWYTSGLPEVTGVRLRLPNSHALLGSGRPWKTPYVSHGTCTCVQFNALLYVRQVSVAGSALPVSDRKWIWLMINYWHLSPKVVLKNIRRKKTEWNRQTYVHLENNH